MCPGVVMAEEGVLQVRGVWEGRGDLSKTCLAVSRVSALVFVTRFSVDDTDVADRVDDVWSAGSPYRLFVSS